MARGEARRLAAAGWTQADIISSLQITMGSSWHPRFAAIVQDEWTSQAMIRHVATLNRNRIVGTQFWFGCPPGTTHMVMTAEIRTLDGSTGDWVRYSQQFVFQTGRRLGTALDDVFNQLRDEAIVRGMTSPQFSAFVPTMRAQFEITYMGCR